MANLIKMSVGHAANVSGASGNGYKEYDVAKELAELTQESLETNNIASMLFFDTKSKKQSTNLDTIENWHLSNEGVIDVSFHFNANEDKNVDGTEVLTVSNKTTASALSAAIALAGGFDDRGYQIRSDLMFTNLSKSAVLLEICFISNKKDMEKYQSKKQEIAEAIAYILAKAVSTDEERKNITPTSWKSKKPIDDKIDKIDVSQLTEISGSSSSTSGSSALVDGTVTDNGFQVTTSGGIVVIDKMPSQFTLAEPIYPDLIQPQVDPEDYVEVTNILLKDKVDEKDRGFVEVTLADMVQQGIDVAKLFFDYEDYVSRTSSADAKEHRYREKVKNFNGPVNHSDPFPVDEKIEELQSHLPYMKVHRLWFSEPDDHTVMMAKTVMDLSDKMEKRMIQVENNLATVYRNLFRLGSRMHINCVYYGGQSEYSKYQSIRCLHDDRINDGQLMTLDQCLNCTRYEPILGKVYEIENELARSLDIINDNNQMAYQSMESTIENTRIEEKPKTKPAKMFIDLKTLTERQDGDQDFKDIWGEGFTMDWTPVAAEEQMPHVRYDDGQTTKTLPSSYKNVESQNDPTGAGFNGNGIFFGPQSSTFYSILGYGGGTTAFTSSSGSGGGSISGSTSLDSIEEVEEAMLKAYEALESTTDAEGAAYYATAEKQNKSKVENTLKTMADYGYEKELNDYATSKGVDPLLMLSIIVVESGGNPEVNIGKAAYQGIMQAHNSKYKDDFKAMSVATRITTSIRQGVDTYIQKTKSIKTNNPSLALAAYNAGEGMILGTKGSKKVHNVYHPSLEESKKDSYTFDDIRVNLVRNAVAYYGESKREEVSLYTARVIYAYVSLLESKRNGGITGRHAKLDQAVIFPYTREDMKSKSMYYLKGKGNYRDTVNGKELQFVHVGMDIKSQAGTSIISIADGKVEKVLKDDKDKGNSVIINHGTFKSVYSHLQSIDAAVKNGAEIKKQTVIGKEGETGIGSSQGNHLHFEIQVADESLDLDTVYNFLSGQRSPDANTPIKFPL